MMAKSMMATNNDRKGIRPAPTPTTLNSSLDRVACNNSRKTGRFNKNIESSSSSSFPGSVDGPQMSPRQPTETAGAAFFTGWIPFLSPNQQQQNNTGEKY